MISQQAIDPAHVNARADNCSTVVAERGQRVVTYRGERSVIVGIYFARGHSGERDLFYILRLPDSPGA